MNKHQRHENELKPQKPSLVWSINKEEVGFMTCTAASHQGAIGFTSLLTVSCTTYHLLCLLKLSDCRRMTSPTARLYWALAFRVYHQGLLGNI